ncbi:hypothetical protein HI914_02863 [Erysiphe necator]|nr:hypothetical protein HI914_02863 [Erysiphe necator]
MVDNSFPMCEVLKLNNREQYRTGIKGARTSDNFSQTEKFLPPADSDQLEKMTERTGSCYPQLHHTILRDIIK